MKQYRAYLDHKELSENELRRQNQLKALQLYEIEIPTQQSMIHKAMNEYIEVYGYNPFDYEYRNQQAIEQLEIANQLKFERILQESLEVDHFLLRQIEERCETIEEEESEESLNESFGFDINRGLDVQEEFKKWQPKNLDSKLALQREVEQLERDLQGFDQVEQYDVPQFGSIDSARFKQQLKSQIEFYSSEIKKSQELQGKQQFKESPQRKQVKRQPKPVEQISLLGSLFTKCALKDMKELNDDGVPEHETFIPVKHEDITVERAFIKQCQKDQEPITEENILGPLRTQLMNEVERIYESENSIQMSRQSSTISLGDQLLQARKNEIFDLVVYFSKELQGKGQLSKQAQIRLQVECDKLNSVSHKSQKDPIQTINARVIRMYDRVSEPMTAAFIQSLKIDEIGKGEQLALSILSPLCVIIAMVDESLPLVNGKLQIQWNIVKRIFSNASQVSNKLRSIVKNLPHIQISEELLKQFVELCKNLDAIDPSLLDHNEYHILLLQIMSIHFAFEVHLISIKRMDRLSLQPLSRIQLNNNSKFESIWKEQGTRYRTKKHKHDAVEARNQALMEQFGIDFKAWELNLQIQEQEVKKAKKKANDLIWKEKRDVKALQQQQRQKENTEIIEENHKQFMLNQALKEHQKQLRQQEFRERQKLKTVASIQSKSYISPAHNKPPSQQIQSQKTIQEYSSIHQFASQVSVQQFTSSTVPQFMPDKVEVAKSQKQISKQQQQLSEAEERVWQKAQELLAKQKELLKQKQMILKQIQQ